MSFFERIKEAGNKFDGLPNNIKWRYVSVIFVLLIIWGIISQHYYNFAMKKYSIIPAVVTEHYYARNYYVVEVDYKFNGVKYNNSFDTDVDTFKTGKRIQIKVSEKYPEKYIDLYQDDYSVTAP